VTQREADLCRLIDARNAATSFLAWRFAQERLADLWRAMGYAAASPACRLADEKMVFPAVRAALEGDGKRGGTDGRCDLRR
jgi:hypothetical protein